MEDGNQTVVQVALNEAFQSLNIEPWLWLDNTLHSREWVEHEQSNHLRKLMMDIGSKLGWGREVPDDDVAAFLSIGLGRDLLRYPPIRSLLVSHRISNGFDSEEDALLRACTIFTLPPQSSFEDVVAHTELLNWRPSTKAALEFCEFICLPSRFARAGSTDDRPPMFLAEPFTPLPPLLDFQSRVKDKIIETLDESGRSLVVMPTGSGKTRTAVESAISFLLNNKMGIGRILWLADRDELCEQAVQSFHQILVHRTSEPVQIWRYWTGNSIDISIKNSRRFVPGVVVTSTQQFRNRIKNGDPIAGHILASCRVVIIDEVHRNLDWNEKILKALDRENSEAAVIGLTATPLRRERHETERLATMFNENAISPIEGGETDPNLCRDVLIEKGILAKRVDVTASELGVQLSVDSSPSKRLAEAIEILTAFIERGADSVLAFAESVSQSRKLASILSLMGMPARHLDSGTPIAERRSIISAFRGGNLKFLFNYDILTTGFDAPNTDAVAIFRTTEDCDQPLITQMVGRGLRGPKFGGTEECMVFIRGMR